MSKNNRSARAFELLVLFSAVLCKTRHEMTKFKVLWRTWTQHGEFSFSHQSTANAQMQVFLVHVFWTLRAQFFLSHILATFTDSKGLLVFFFLAAYLESLSFCQNDTEFVILIKWNVSVSNIINPLSPNSDQNSPCNINSYSTSEVTKIKDMITRSEFS